MIRRLAVCLAGLAALAAWPASSAAATTQDDVYGLVGGCYALQPGGDAFRFQATELGQYLLYDKDRRFLAIKGDGGTERAGEPSPAADFKVTPSGDGFRFEANGKQLENGRTFTPTRAEGCPAYPEVETSAEGKPLTQPTSFGETRGYIDLHMHMMAFEFLGGRAHCGRPWHRYGAPYALVDCPDHEPNGGGAILENTISYGSPVGTHDTVGWPTFRDWPHHKSLTHEQSYYKWLERAWMGGLRVMVNLFVDNAALCKVYPYKADRPEPCNEMATVRLQHKRIFELQNYIDAQAGGPGKGFFRIVTDPFEARRVISEGKLAIVLGIEISKLFDCGHVNDAPTCTREQVDQQLDEAIRMGVRDMELVNKFDNAFSGVAGDAGSTGVLVNGANKLETNTFWNMQTCSGDPDKKDREQLTPANQDQDQIFGNAARLLPQQGQLPLYPSPPHCNQRGLTQLGEHLVRRMIEKGIIIDPDHQSVLGRDGTLALAEAANYSGVVSSHSWSDPKAVPRILRLGGVVTPISGRSAKNFAEEYKKIKPMRDPRYFFGFGYGADMNGFAGQSEPRGGENPLKYPFKSFDGGVTLHKQRSGERVFDLNVDGVAHYGLFPDWIEDLRQLAGNEIVEDMSRGSEAYLQMWERAAGVPATTCRAAHLDANRLGLGGVALGATTEQVLRRASQPRERGARRWAWCVRGRGNGAKTVAAVLTPEGRVGLVMSNGRGHRARDVGPGAKTSKVRRGTRAFGRGVRVRRVGGGAKQVWIVRKGRVRWTGVAARPAARTRGALRTYLRLGGVIR